MTPQNRGSAGHTTSNKIATTVNHTKRIFQCLALAYVCVSVAQAGEPITIESLLTELIDRDAVARFPQPDFRLRQQSSYDRLSKTPDDPDGWFIIDALTIVALAVPCHAAGDGASPNVIFVLTDDLGYSDVGCYGATKVKTEMHRSGIRQNSRRVIEYCRRSDWNSGEFHYRR